MSICQYNAYLEGTSLAAEVLAGATDPHVLGLNTGALGQGHVPDRRRASFMIMMYHLLAFLAYNGVGGADARVGGRRGGCAGTWVS